MGAVFALFSAWYFWTPKIAGLSYNMKLGKVHFVILFIGVNVTFFPQHFLGLQGMPRRISDYPDAFAGWNLISSYGSLISVVATWLFLHILYVQLVEGKATQKYPWLAPQYYGDLFQTLFSRNYITIEWTLDSPPKPHAFTSLPLQSWGMKITNRFMKLLAIITMSALIRFTLIWYFEPDFSVILDYLLVYVPSALMPTAMFSGQDPPGTGNPGNGQDPPGTGNPGSGQNGGAGRPTRTTNELRSEVLDFDLHRRASANLERVRARVDTLRSRYVEKSALDITLRAEYSAALTRHAPPAELYRLRGEMLNAALQALDAKTSYNDTIAEMDRTMTRVELYGARVRNHLLRADSDDESNNT